MAKARKPGKSAFRLRVSGPRRPFASWAAAAALTRCTHAVFCCERAPHDSRKIWCRARRHFTSLGAGLRGGMMSFWLSSPWTDGAADRVPEPDFSSKDVVCEVCLPEARHEHGQCTPQKERGNGIPELGDGIRLQQCKSVYVCQTVKRDTMGVPAHPAPGCCICCYICACTYLRATPMTCSNLRSLSASDHRPDSTINVKRNDCFGYKCFHTSTRAWLVTAPPYAHPLVLFPPLL